MAKAIALWTGGIHNLTEVAIRDDGVLFQRFQERDSRYGYRWTGWKATGETLGHNARANPESVRQSGFSNLRLTHENSSCVNDAARWKDGKLRVRLPN